MRRVLRNYLISFLIIGIFFLIVHLINQAVEQNMPEAKNTGMPETTRTSGNE